MDLKIIFPSYAMGGLQADGLANIKHLFHATVTWPVRIFED